MSYFKNIGQLEDLKNRRELVATQICSHRESIRNSLNIIADVEEIQGEYVMQLAISLNERGIELAGYDKKIAVLSHETGK